MCTSLISPTLISSRKVAWLNVCQLSFYGNVSVGESYEGCQNFTLRQKKRSQNVLSV
jgi:hypothetical protein